MLFDVLPGLAQTVPWRPLARLPTAVEPCDAIRDWLGRSGVFMKRDDLASPLYGGNKVRRYEFVLADAAARGSKRIVTVGGLASTQAMATALFGHALGFDVCMVLFDQPMTDFARDALLGFAASGAEIVHGGGYLMTALRTMKAMRRVPGSYLILPGAANALANLGYVDAMLELAGQVERGEAPRPDAIVLPTGSSGTLAALALGAAWLGWNTEIIGVRITSTLACNRFTIDRIVRNTDRFLERHDARWKAMRGRVNYSIYGGALGRGYGYPTPEALEGAERVRDLTGASGEVTYSGKALAALHELARKPAYRDKTLLLWNTLSTPRPALVPGAEARLPPSLRKLVTSTS
ncbi:pyridoxal phosphate-dependent deaminase, putative [Labilithrix luteola]|uniref:Pyridoxal phosphate-dependent deaminase, putative n=1 Tax=Labilithrix luteola TaxID=1391654 RepID=A0A0K1QFR2_9BACT|nr:pyridoxal phosphate-dependent deaminase, putative [Labilithrix luteola]